MKHILIKHIQNNNTVNLGRSLTAEQRQQVIQSTSFLKNSKNFNERVYCIINDIKKQPLDIFGNKARFVNINQGYSFKVDTAIKQLKGAITDLKKQKRSLDAIIIKNLKSRSSELSQQIKTQKSIAKFKLQNRKRNLNLYQPSKRKDVDYIICPVSNERMSMIKTSYIKNILGMTVDEYDNLYPGARGVSEARKKNIKAGLHKVDSKTGKTAYQISQEKARKKLSEVDEHGISGYKRKGQRTRATHMNNIDKFGRNGYSQLASKAIVKGNLTKAEKGLILDPIDRNEYYRYKMIVLYITEKLRQEITKGYKTGLAGTPGAYHIDHMFSIMNGYKNYVSPLVIGNKANLKMIPWKDNLSKHSSCSISLDDLIINSNYTIDQSQKEYLYFIDLIKNDIQNQKPSSGALLMEKFYESKLYRK